MVEQPVKVEGSGRLHERGDFVNFTFDVFPIDVLFSSCGLSSVSALFRGGLVESAILTGTRILEAVMVVGKLKADESLEVRGLYPCEGQETLAEETEELFFNTSRRRGLSPALNELLPSHWLVRLLDAYREGVLLAGASLPLWSHRPSSFMVSTQS